MIWRYPGGYFESFEGDIGIEIKYVDGWLIKLKKYLGIATEIEQLVEPPLRHICVIHKDQYWNFKLEKFTDYNAKDCIKLINVSEEAAWKNFFTIYHRSEEEARHAPKV